jgi:hypothetical protein
MNQRYDITTPRPKKNSDKPYWHKVGSAFADERGGFTCYLDSLPLQDNEGRCVLKLFEAKDRDQQHRDNLNRNPPADDTDSSPF